MATQGLRIVLNFADASDNKEILKNLTLEYDDLQKIRTIRDGENSTDERLRQEDLRTLSGLDYHFEKETVALATELQLYNSLSSDFNNARVNLNFSLDLNGRAISPSFKFRKINFDTSTISLVDFSTSRRSAWSNFGLAEDSVFYGNQVKLSGLTSSVDLTNLDVQSDLLERRFESQIPTHKVQVEINGNTYEMFAMKGIPVVFRGQFRSGLLIYTYTVLPGGQAPTIVIKNVGDSEEVIYPVINSSPSISAVTQIVGLDTVQDRYIEFYYPGDNLIELIYDDLSITDFPRVVMTNLQKLSLFRSFLSELPDFRTYTPNLLSLDISNSFDLRLTDIPEERTLSQDILNKLPLSLEELLMSSVFDGNITTNFTTFTNLTKLDIGGSVGSRLAEGSLVLNSGLESLNIAENNFISLPTSITTHQQLKVLDINNNPFLPPFSIFGEFIPERIIDISNLQNSLEYLKYGGARNGGTNPIDVSGFTSLVTYLITEYEIDSLFYEAAYIDYVTATNFWFGCSSLEELDVEIVGLTGAFPNFATNTSLKSINFSSTIFTPAVTDYSIDFNTFGPEDGGCRPTLESITILDQNGGPGFALDKPVHPDAFIDMISLEEIIFFNTPFGGEIPSLLDCISLTKFAWSNCGLTGSLPSFSTNDGILEINVDTNLLTGQVPSLDLPRLQILNITFNEIDNFNSINTPNLQFLNAGRNNIQNFPAIGALTQLRTIELNDNQISVYPLVGGRGPLSDLGFLTLLDLSNNNLSTSDIDAILEDLNYSYDNSSRSNAIINLLGNSSPSPTARIQAIINKLRTEANWQIDVDV